jgi:hypothetical protein
MPEPERRPAFYASRGSGGWHGWWTILHPPYTAWHLSYVAIGAALAADLDAGRLAASLVAFLAATGIAAHALDEVRGHPLRTGISDAALVGATAAGLAVAVALGVVGIARVGPALIPFVVVGPVLVIAYNLELFGGRVHTDLGFALAWGAFPLLTGYVAQTGTVSVAAMVVATAAVAFSYAQRTLSTPARDLRRRTERVDGTVVAADGTVRPLDAPTLLAPLERSLLVLSGAMVLMAAGLVVMRLA